MKEKIIIDGVDVAGCEFYFEDNGVIAPDRTPERANICTSSEKSCENNDSCYCNKDCYYKQLKRLEQENEELKEELASFMNGDYCAKGCKKMNNAFQDAHKCILEESERLYSSQIEEFEENLHNLKQENKQLKKENKELKKEIEWTLGLVIMIIIAQAITIVL